MLVTGGAGFIGSGFVKMALQRGHVVDVVDALTYAGNMMNLADHIENEQFNFIKWDISNDETVRLIERGYDAIINYAAESHVDKSIIDASSFAKSNIIGVQRLLDSIRKVNKPVRFVQISTDEVYGSADDGLPFTELNSLKPNSPYAATKAAADLLTLAYYRTYGLDVVITRCSNNYGPYQYPEKLIPLFITNLFESKKVPVYGDGMQIRDWIHRDDHNEGILLALSKGRSGEVYNFGGGNAVPNMQIVRTLLEKTGRDESYIEFVKDRLGHDRAYLIDYKKATSELGWTPQMNFEVGISETVKWYRDNEIWWRAVKSGEYRKYYEKQYGINSILATQVES